MLLPYQSHSGRPCFCQTLPCIFLLSFHFQCSCTTGESYVAQVEVIHLHSDSASVSARHSRGLPIQNYFWGQYFSLTFSDYVSNVNSNHKLCEGQPMIMNPRKLFFPSQSPGLKNKLSSYLFPELKGNFFLSSFHEICTLSRDSALIWVLRTLYLLSGSRPSILSLVGNNEISSLISLLYTFLSLLFISSLFVSGF